MMFATILRNLALRLRPVLATYSDKFPPSYRNGIVLFVWSNTSKLDMFPCCTLHVLLFFQTLFHRMSLFGQR